MDGIYTATSIVVLPHIAIVLRFVSSRVFEIHADARRWFDSELEMDDSARSRRQSGGQGRRGEVTRRRPSEDDDELVEVEVEVEESLTGRSGVLEKDGVGADDGDTDDRSETDGRVASFDPMLLC